MESRVNDGGEAGATPNARRNTKIRLAILFLLGAIAILTMLRSNSPTNLGVHNGQLAPCPDKPNCVSTQAEQETQRIEPLRLNTDAAVAMEVLLSALGEMPRTQVVVTDADYTRVECTTALMRYVDDLEVWIDSGHELIHARSASRIGYSDWGANRKRVELLFEQLVESGIGSRRSKSATSEHDRPN